MGVQYPSSRRCGRSSFNVDTTTSHLQVPFFDVFHAILRPLPRAVLPSHITQRIASTVAEGLEVEDHEVTKRAEGTRMFRSAQFWGRSAIIYLSYKTMQARYGEDCSWGVVSLASVVSQVYASRSALLILFLLGP